MCEFYVEQLQHLRGSMSWINQQYTKNIERERTSLWAPQDWPNHLMVFVYKLGISGPQLRDLFCQSFLRFFFKFLFCINHFFRVWKYLDRKEQEWATTLSPLCTWLHITGFSDISTEQYIKNKKKKEFALRIRYKI